MVRPIRTGALALQRARRDVRSTQSAAQLRAALAVLLPAEVGLTIEQTARALGRNPSWVSRTRNRFISGDADFAGPEARGGRRRQLLTPARELALVKQALVRNRGSWRHLRQDLRELLQTELDSDPAASTVTAILTRAAAQLLPNGKIWELNRWSGHLAEICRTEAHLASFRR